MTSKTESHAQRIVSTFRDHGSPEDRIQKALQDLLAVTDSRAVGFWQLEGESLSLVGFHAKSDMPLEVQMGFIEATRKVPLTQTGLGIVKAIFNRGPAVAHVEVGQNGLQDSAGWLAKFEAVQSLAVPIARDEQILGVLAMSTANPFVENDDTWRLLTGIAEQLGH